VTALRDPVKKQMHEHDAEKMLEQGLFADIDIHFARLMSRLSHGHGEEVFRAAALTSRATQGGHVCLDLESAGGLPLDEALLDDSIPAFPDLDDWVKNLRASGVVGRPGDVMPLILDHSSRLYLHRYWEYESSLARGLGTLAAQEFEAEDLPMLGKGLSRLFPCVGEEGPHWQKAAAFIAATRRLCVITGGPGTGKSTLIAKILALLLDQPESKNMRIALAAPTGKAAARLQEAVRNVTESLPLDEDARNALALKASTIHRLMGAIAGSPFFRHNAENPLAYDTVVIDEASMVDLALLSKLVQALPSRARLILLGDRDQLASVEAGAVLGDICGKERMSEFSARLAQGFEAPTGERLPAGAGAGEENPLGDCVVELTRNYRFDEKSGIASLSRAVRNGDGDQCLEILEGRSFEDIAWQTLPGPDALEGALKEKIIEGYSEYLSAQDPLEAFALFDRFRILCAVRRGPWGVSGLNLLVERILKQEGLIRPEKRWYRGRPVLITRNDYNLGLFNGDIGIVMAKGNQGDLYAFFTAPDGSLKRFLPARLPEHETVYAMTVHKSQGSEFETALLVLPERPSPVITRELLYTGITRARKRMEVWAGEKVFLEGVRHRTGRASGLKQALWGA
jgi:exodeoxyribonuclease V alpha subunit